MTSYQCMNCAKNNLESFFRCCSPPSFPFKVFYCSQKCQIQDWPSHKNFCCHKTKINKYANETIKSVESDSDIENSMLIEKELRPETKTELDLAIEIEQDKINLSNASFPIASTNKDEETILKEEELKQSELLPVEEDEEEKPQNWSNVEVDDSKRMQIAIMSSAKGMKHIKLRYIIRELENEEFEPVDVSEEHVDSAFEASFDVLENYDDFLLITRCNESINNFASITFEADFSLIFQVIRAMKHRRRSAIESGDKALEMQLNHDVLKLIRQREKIENAYNKAKLEVTRNGILLVECNSDGLYNFAGSSPSRNQTCFFYKGSPQKIFEMIHSMGDFSLIPDIEKRAKRIGLLFSSVRVGFEIDSSQWELIDDIESSEFNYTDGCGFISPDLITRACSILGKEKKAPTSFPCVIQVRFLGFKGILLLKKELSGRIEFRKSMLKFEVPWAKTRESFLGVINYSAPFNLTYISLQSVMLLSSLGVEDSTFFELQNEYFDKLEVLQICPETAFEFCKLRDRDLMNLMLQCGFTKVVINRLRLLRRLELERSVKKIRRISGNKYEVERLRILVPRGRIVYGVCDPYGLLNYGECYFSPTVNNGFPRIFKNCEVIVFRNPCYHLGDIRKLKCVDFPNRKYSMYRDVIVFPTVGPRPHSNEMSSGDLDGDMYSVIWDTRFVDSVKTVEPFSISMPDDGTLTKNRRTTSSIQELFERQKWFATHSSNNSLGQINRAFVKYANRYGPSHSECVKIGTMFNMSLDSGVYDEAHLREISRRVNSSLWERQEDNEKVWQRLLINGRRRRRELMVDSGIIIYVREEDGLAIAQCRKRERIFVDSNLGDTKLKIGDCIKFGVKWNRIKRILMAEDVVLLKDKNIDLVQKIRVQRLFGTVTRYKKLPEMNIPMNLPDNMRPPKIEGYIYFEHSYMKSVLRGDNGNKETIASYLKFDDRSFEGESLLLNKGDKVSFSLCFATNGSLCARELRLMIENE